MMFVRIRLLESLQEHEEAPIAAVREPVLVSSLDLLGIEWLRVSSPPRPCRLCGGGRGREKRERGEETPKNAAGKERHAHDRASLRPNRYAARPWV